MGTEIVWAVIDSGIDGGHPHFTKHRISSFAVTLEHRDFTALNGDGNPLHDVFGHGTHVAGIIAGEMVATAPRRSCTRTRFRTEDDEVRPSRATSSKRISGHGSRCKLLSLKVLDDQGDGEVSNIIAAIEYIQEVNGYGRRLQVHGVNLSIGYEFEPKWFACGQSPLCVEVDRLVKSGWLSWSRLETRATA